MINGISGFAMTKKRAATALLSLLFIAVGAGTVYAAVAEPDQVRSESSSTVATNDELTAALGARLLNLVETKTAAKVPVSETVAEINRQTDAAIADGVGVSARDPKAYQLAQIALLETRASALRRLADSTGDARLTRYSDLLDEMYGKLKGDIQGGDLKASLSPAYLPFVNELREIEQELGIPGQP